MKQPDALKRENEALRDRLSRLSRASLQINESLDFDAVLQSVLDSACSLTGARCGVLTLLDESEYAGDFLSSGMTYEEAERIWDVPDALKLYEYLGDISEPFRHNDVTGYMRSLGLAEAHLPESLSSPVSFLAAPILHGGERVGNIFLGVKAVEREFTSEDEETLVMFACQAALVLANARRYRDEQRARDNLETLISTSPVGVVVFDARLGVALSLNQEARRIVSHLKMPGRSIEELLELITYRRADGREIALDEIPLARTLNTGETVRLEEIVMQVPDGRSVTALINATPIYSEKGEIDSVVVTMQDMTPLEEMERLRAQFMGMVSHEMRTPLTSIKGSVDTLLDDAASLDPAEMREFHRVISEQTDRMRSLINDLRDAARIETGTLSVAPEPSDVAVMVDEARSLFLSTGRRHGIRIEIAPGLPQVMTDKRRIVQVLSNLFSNAARFSDEESMIKVSAAQEGFQVAVSVTDEGRGIPAERLPHLFRRSYRINNKDGHGDHEGSGLGLAICRGIVEAHGGRIWAESGGLGLGARFTFTLPVAEKEGSGESVETAFASERPEQPPIGRTPILAVDDDPHALRYIRSILSKADYDPIVTGNPEDVGRLIQEKKPHLVLLDLMLPGTDGIALMRDILAKDDLPVIFLSAYGQEDLIAKAFDMGAVDYVAKPFSPTELAARIRAALRRRSGGGLLMQSGSYRQGALTVNYAERRVLVAGRPIVLTATEYALLFELSTNAGRVMSHEQLLRQVWGEGHSSDAGLVRTIVKRLRQKLGDDAHSPQYIFTEPRVGYRMRKVELA
ncbi:MAG: response regulator [Caldilineaceae bacterium]|nr:response regulator [Caldilineaceae bacterium]MDE0070312.1 response regulator [Caldilineaceae bacterium]MDE0182031.1 response regulator [Caldilineaceae bacterium]